MWSKLIKMPPLSPYGNFRIAVHDVSVPRNEQSNALAVKIIYHVLAPNIP